MDKKLTTDEILEKLDQTSQKARFISILLTAGLFLILVVVAFLTYSTINNLNNAKEELSNVQTLANKERETIEALRKEKSGLENSGIYYANTIEKVNELHTKNANLNEAKSILSNASKTIAKEPVANVSPIKIKTPDVMPANTMATNTQTSENKNPTTVYVQITNEEQRPFARQIIRKLSGNDFKFPGIELVERKTSKTQIIYFHKEDKKAADELVKKLDSAGISAVTVFSPLKAPENLLEIWFANDSF